MEAILLNQLDQLNKQKDRTILRLNAEINEMKAQGQEVLQSFNDFICQMRRHNDDLNSSITEKMEEIDQNVLLLQCRVDGVANQRCLESFVKGVIEKQMAAINNQVQSLQLRVSEDVNQPIKEEHDSAHNSHSSKRSSSASFIGSEVAMLLLDKAQGLVDQMSNVPRPSPVIEIKSETSATHQDLKNEFNVMRKERDELALSFDYLAKRHEEEIFALKLERDSAIEQRNEMSQPVNIYAEKDEDQTNEYPQLKLLAEESRRMFGQTEAEASLDRVLFASGSIAATIAAETKDLQTMDSAFHNLRFF